MFFLVKCSLHMLSFLWKAADVLLRVSRWKNKLKHHRFDRKKECTEPMKKSCLIAVITALAAVAGALAAAAVYLHRREKERTSTSVCSLARTMQKRSSRKLPKRHLPRMLQNKPNTGHKGGAPAV